MDAHDVDAIEEILAEALLLDVSLEVAIGRCNQAGIERHFDVAAHGSHRALLERAQELGLGIRTHFRDLVEKQGAALRRTEQPQIFGGCAAECAPLVTKQLTLEQYIQTNPLNNIQTRLLAGGASAVDSLADDCTAETLATAKDNLARHFSLIGLTERFDESLALAKLLFGWKITRYARFRVTQNRPKMETISPRVLSLIEDHCQFDIALYQYATTLFEQALADRASDLQFQLEAIRQANISTMRDSVYYQTASLARQALCLINSQL